MGKLSPISHRELLSRLRELGFEGPYGGGKHLYMVRGQLRLTVPNVHAAEIGVPLLARILRQAGVSVDEWMDVQ